MPNQALLDALRTVYGTFATKDEYPTATVLGAMNKLLGRMDTPITELELIEQLRQLNWAHPRPGKGRHLLSWRFSNANGAPAATTRRRVPRQSKSIAESQRLTR